MTLSLQSTAEAVLVLPPRDPQSTHEKRIHDES